jgi:hypothetical protein
MTNWQDIHHSPGDVVTIRTIWLALALSLLIHGAALLVWLPRMPLLPKEIAGPSAANAPLAVRLATPIGAASAPAPRPAPEPPPRHLPVPKAPAAAIAARPRPAPPLTALVASQPIPVPALPVPALPAPPPPAPESRAVAGDLAAYVAARRSARGDADPAANASPANDEKARRDRALAANIASINALPQGKATSNSGGVFQITRLGYDDAEFTFFGWHKDFGRRLSQKIEVRRDKDADIRTTVIRRMIAIIREYEQEDFIWRSQRHGDITLSARPADNAELERFFMRDFFGEPAPGR